MDRDFTLDELRLLKLAVTVLKLAVTLAIDEVSGRRQPHTELESQLDAMYLKLRDLGA